MVEKKAFIGLPVYNGERFLQLALDSLIAQTYTDWELLISDNASTDRTEEICRLVSQDDRRIAYIRHRKNLRVAANFDYVLSQATGEYFMWAAADDEWDPRFLASCIELLEEQRDAGFAFSNAVNIDSRGFTIRKFSPYSRFATPSRKDNLFRFTTEGEAMGKWNLLYSVFRLDFLQEAWPHFHSIWHHRQAVYAGADMACMLGLLARRPVAICNEVLFKKRLVSLRDAIDEAQFLHYEDRLKIRLPNHLFRIHRRYMIGACRKTSWWWRAAWLMTRLYVQLRIYRRVRRWLKRLHSRPRRIRV